MMSIDEAIVFSQEKSRQQYQEIEGYEYDAEEHRQVSEWLEELKDLRKWKELEEKSCDKYYNKGIKDTTLSVWKKAIAKHDECLSLEELDEILDEVIAEQMKDSKK